MEAFSKLCLPRHILPQVPAGGGDRTLQQATAMLPVPRVQSRAESKQPEVASATSKAQSGQRAISWGVGTALAPGLLLHKLQMAIQKTETGERWQRKCSHAAHANAHPLQTFGTYYLTAGFSCFTLRPRQSKMCLRCF